MAVDLNCLLLNLERTIAEALQVARNVQETERFEELAACRETAIQKYLWNEEKGFYFDYEIARGQNNAMTLAGVFPLFVKVATEEQAKEVAGTIEKNFLMSGGVVTTPGDNRPTVGCSEWLGAAAVDHDRWSRELRSPRARRRSCQPMDQPELRCVQAYRQVDGKVQRC